MTELVIRDVMLFFLTLIFVIILHESGHYVAGILCGFKPKLTAGIKSNLDFHLGLYIGETKTDEEYIFINICGIIMGLIPIFLLIIKNTTLAMPILLIYILLCLDDIIGLYRMKHKTEKFKKEHNTTTVD